MTDTFFQWVTFANMIFSFIAAIVLYNQNPNMALWASMAGLAWLSAFTLRLELKQLKRKNESS